jgi:hypothetical protein
VLEVLALFEEHEHPGSVYQEAKASYAERYG